MEYTGKLAKTIRRKRIGLLAEHSAYEAEALRITNEMLSKLPDLFKAHGVAENNYFGLVLALAKEHVPGFKVTNPSGRPTEWDDIDKAEFKLDMDTIRDKTSFSVVEAIKQVIRLDHWREKTRPMNVPALEVRYYRADARWVNIIRDARVMNQLLDAD